MDESFPAKRFKFNKMINRATSGSEATLHISEQFVGFKMVLQMHFYIRPFNKMLNYGDFSL